MCVIAYKAKNVRFPSDKNIREMWDHNSDGAGIMWRDENELIHFRKGFMKLKNFEKWIKKNREWLEDVECALHFRITTHGGTSQGNCHPFVVDSGANPHSLEGTANRVLMHNGVLELIPRSEDISDSAELALRLGGVACPRNSMSVLNEQLAGNRIILMDETGTYFFGDPFKESGDKENEGILYSNLNWTFVSMKNFGLGYGANNSFDYGVFYDKKTHTWRERYTNLPIDIDDVYPEELSDSDYHEWVKQTSELESDKSKKQICDYYGLTGDEYYMYKREAKEYGYVNVEDYIRNVICEDFDVVEQEERAAV